MTKAALILLLALTGCVGPDVQIPPPASGAEASFQSALGRRVALGGLTVMPLAIVEDSRCPANVQCIQAGTVRLKVKLREDGGDRLAVVGLDQPVALTDGSWLHLAAVCPVRATPDKIEPGAYVFTFLLSHGNDRPDSQYACPRAGWSWNNGGGPSRSTR